MSKKTQRKVTESVATTERKISSTSGSSSGRASLSAEFNPDYTLIVRDLKITGILAGTFIGILVILSFFLR